MFEVIVANGPSKRVDTEAEKDDFIVKVQALFSDKVTIMVNEIEPLFDKKGVQVSSMTKRIAELPVKKP